MFPKDHNTHNTQVEWWYFWGRLNTGHFFHFANFRSMLGRHKARATHFSLHLNDSQYFEEVENDLQDMQSNTGYNGTDRFYFQNKIISMIAYPKYPVIIHPVKDERNYYSIPLLTGDGFMGGNKITSEIWFDHEFSDLTFDIGDWDWICIKLKMGAYVMVFASKHESFCQFIFGGKSHECKFHINHRILTLYELGIILEMEPIVDEKIFEPLFGPKYSEQPICVFDSCGKLIGYGMRERTYRNATDNNSSTRIR